MPSGTAVREKIKADSPDALIAQASTEQHERRQRAAEEYRKLLSQGGDPRVLRECMGILGRTAADLEGDRELVKQVAAYEQAAEQHAVALAAYKKAKPDYRQRVEGIALRRAALEKQLEELGAEGERTAMTLSSPLGTVNVLDRQIHDRTAIHAWGAIVAGIPLEEYLGQKRRERMTKHAAPPPGRFVRTQARRAEIIGKARDEYRNNERLHLYPPDRGEIRWVNEHLGQSAESKLTPEETKEFGLRDGWQEEKNREARVQRDTERRKAKLEAGKSAEAPA